MSDQATKPSDDAWKGRLLATLSRRPECSSIDGGAEPAIPARAIVSVLDDYRAEHGHPLLDLVREQNLKQMFELQSDLEPDKLVAFKDLVTFIKEFSAASLSTPVVHETDSPERVEAVLDDEHLDEDHAGHTLSRSSSNDSISTSIYRPESRHSRPPSVSSTPGDRRPSVSSSNSPFDSQMRQRAVPLSNPPPSSFRKKPQAPSRRRKSDSTHSGTSDSEGPSFRRRAPSNPTSPPASQSVPSFPMLDSPPVHMSRKAVSAPGSAGSSPDNSFTFPARPRDFPLNSPPQMAEEADDDDDEFVGEDSMASVDMMLNPETFAHEGGDSDDDTASMKDNLIRPHLPSDASMSTPEERVEALQRVNIDLSRKFKELDRHLHDRLSEREFEIEELTMRLDEMRVELQAARKDEKDLRQREVVLTKQLNNYEQDVGRLTRELERARNAHQNLLRQYNEQCAEAEKYRVVLREKDNRIKNGEQDILERMAEVTRVKAEKDILENTIAALHEELNFARSAQHELEDQKHENLALKETIDRLRYEMDGLRDAVDSKIKSAASSRHGTLTRSLANELNNQVLSPDREDPVVQSPTADLSMETATTEINDDMDEDYVETIITKSRRRKIPGRSGTITRIEESKEYADASIQHDPTDFVQSSSSQTDPPPPLPKMSQMDIQTDPEPVPPVRITASIEIQTEVEDAAEPEADRSMEAGPSGLKPVVKEEEEELASSVETIRPGSPSNLPLDSPPSYEKVAEHERHKLLLKWHPGLHGKASPGVEGGITSTVLREWANVKKELGFECEVVERTLNSSKVNGEREDEVKDEDVEEAPSGSRRGSRIYNIYNTFTVWNGKEGATGGAGEGVSGSVPWRDLLMLGAGAGIVFFAVGVSAVQNSYLARQHYFANTVVGVDVAHGLGHRPTYDAFWLLVEGVLHRGLDAARRAPPFPPT